VIHIANRRGLGKGKGKGWKNIIASDRYRHRLSGLGIKNAVSLSQTKRKAIKSKLLPLLANHTISGYNLVETPRLKGFRKYRIIYGHDIIRKHRDKIINELKSRNLNYYVMPREAKFLSDKAFIKTPKQITKGDIISNDKEYQIIIDANSKELKGFEKWLKTKSGQL